MRLAQSGPRIAIFVGITTLGLVACSDNSTSPSDSEDDCVLGLVQTNQQDVFFTQMNQGATDAADELGCELTIVNGDNDPAKQSSDLQQLVGQGVGGVVVVAIDADTMAQAVSEALDQNVFIVAVDQDIGEGNYDTFVGIDNGDAAEEFADWLLDEETVDGMRYGMINAPASAIQNIREDGFTDIIDANGAEFTQSVNGDNQNEKANQAAYELLVAQDDLDFIYTTGTPATLGAVSALTDRGDETRVVGWDLTQDIITGIDDGIVRAIVQQDSYAEGYEGVQELHSLLQGEEAAGTIHIPTTIVTSDNVDDFREIYN